MTVQDQIRIQQQVIKDLTTTLEQVAADAEAYGADVDYAKPMIKAGRRSLTSTWE